MLERSSSLTLVAFDLIELQADDLSNVPLAHRKPRLAKLLARGSCAITYNEYLEHDGPAVFNHACRLGLDGIVSKRLDSPYRSGPSKTWLKSKNPLSEAVRRKREEDWS
jgi:bifunctional non-homologous end joining protein LigD